MKRSAKMDNVNFMFFTFGLNSFIFFRELPNLNDPYLQRHHARNSAA